MDSDDLSYYFDIKMVLFSYKLLGELNRFEFTYLLYLQTRPAYVIRIIHYSNFPYTYFDLVIHTYLDYARLFSARSIKALQANIKLTCL